MRPTSAAVALVLWTVASVPLASRPVAQGQAPIVLPVERASNVFFVRTQINGRGPFWFTVDTGATLTVIDPSTARRAGLVVRPAGRRPNVGVGEEDTELATTAATIQIAGLPDFAPSFFYVMPVQSAASALGHAIDGVIGTDLFEGEANSQFIGRSGSQVHEATSSHTRTSSRAGGINVLGIGVSGRSSTTDVTGTRDVTQVTISRCRPWPSHQPPEISPHVDVGWRI